MSRSGVRALFSALSLCLCVAAVWCCLCSWALAVSAAASAAASPVVGGGGAHCHLPHQRTFEGEVHGAKLKYDTRSSPANDTFAGASSAPLLGASQGASAQPVLLAGGSASSSSWLLHEEAQEAADGVALPSCPSGDGDGDEDEEEDEEEETSRRGGRARAAWFVRWWHALWGMVRAALALAVVAPGRRLAFWLGIKILQCGDVPHHVAFIMDGNRRWARQRHMPVSKGHKSGYSKLQDLLQWCLDLGVRVVTVYAFSIENFKRSAREVQELMELAGRKFDQIARETSVIEEHRVRVRVLGCLHMLSPELQESIRRAEEATAHNRGATLNICMAYTSCEEIVHAARRTGAILEHGRSEEKHDERDTGEGEEKRMRPVEDHLYTHEVPPPDLLVRTSGETRLSDFLLWQVLWPDISPFSFLWFIVDFQRQLPKVQERVSRMAPSQCARLPVTVAAGCHWCQDATAAGGEGRLACQEPLLTVREPAALCAHSSAVQHGRVLGKATLLLPRLAAFSA